MTFNAPIDQAYLNVADWQDRFQLAVDSGPPLDTHTLPETQLCVAQIQNLADILRELRDRTALYFTAIQRGLHQLKPATFPDPDHPPPANRATWSQLPATGTALDEHE